MLSRLIYSNDVEILTDACWALSYLSDGPNERIQAVIESGVCRRLVELLLHSSFLVQQSALRAVGNIVTGDDYQTLVMINACVLPCLLALLHSPKNAIRKEACWTISSITAGNRAQIQAVIDNQIIQPLIILLSDTSVNKEAAWALSNASSGGSADQIGYLVQNGIIKPMCELFNSAPDSRLILVALECIENILKAGDVGAKDTGVNEYASRVEECGGLDKLEQLQNHEHNEINEKAVRILENYFSAEEDPNMVSGEMELDVPVLISLNSTKKFSF
jgi:HEAT repeat protein